MGGFAKPLKEVSTAQKVFNTRTDGLWETRIANILEWKRTVENFFGLRGDVENVPPKREFSTDYLFGC
jgi:hypothetical protein